MTPNSKISIAIALVAAIAIGAVAIPKIDIGGSDDEPGAQGSREPVKEEPAAAEQPVEPEKPEPPSSPDDVTGDQDISLTRPENFRRALAVLEKRRQAFEGVYDSLRVAPGRIDTIIEARDKRSVIQVRTDFKVAFASTSDFPSQPGFRRGGFALKDVDVRGPARILERIDGVRRGSSAARDVDYVVIRRDIIDFSMNLAAFLRTGPRPRAFSLEADEPFRVIG